MPTHKQNISNQGPGQSIKLQFSYNILHSIQAKELQPQQVESHQQCSEGI